MQWKLGPGVAIVVVVVGAVAVAFVGKCCCSCRWPDRKRLGRACKQLQPNSNTFSIFNNKQVQTDMKAKLGDQFEAVKVTTFLFACRSHTSQFSCLPCITHDPRRRYLCIFMGMSFTEG